MSLRCSITTPERLVHEGAARLVVVPASDGELGILPRHSPLMALLGTGELRLEMEGGTKASFFVSGGFIQVIGNEVNVLATDAAAAGEIDRQAAREALEKLRARGRPAGLPAADQRARQAELRAAALRARIATGESSAGE